MHTDCTRVRVKREVSKTFFFACIICVVLQSADCKNEYVVVVVILKTNRFGLFANVETLESSRNVRGKITVFVERSTDF